MNGPVLGLHHVTATVGDAQADLDFAVAALGLRLVKKTVNFDNHGVYHFYYGNARGTPGTIWTTFPYRGHGVRIGSRGTGQITTVSFSVPAGSLEFWRRRLADVGCTTADHPPILGDAALLVVDPSGLRIALVANADDARAPWTDVVDEQAAIRGLYSVTLTVRSLAPTVAFMTSVLGFVVVHEGEHRVRVAVNGDEPGRRMEIVEAPDDPAAVNGVGTVHHVAMGVATADEQRRMRAELVRAGRNVTEIFDRQYFTSIYFREPGGVLFEIATLPPGFLVDETDADLGTSLKLPPWEEPQRAAIERALPPVIHP